MKSSKPPPHRSRKVPIQREIKQKPKDPVEVGFHLDSHAQDDPKSPSFPYTQVYCRVRPLKEDEDESCAEVVTDNTLQLTPPECSLAFKSGHFNGVRK